MGRFGVEIISMLDIGMFENGVGPAFIEQLNERFVQAGGEDLPIYLSLDLDVLDPAF